MGKYLRIHKIPNFTHPQIHVSSFLHHEHEPRLGELLDDKFRRGSAAPVVNALD